MEKRGAGRPAKIAVGAGALLLIAAIGLLIGFGGFPSLFAQGRTGALPELLSREKSLERYQTLLETFNTVREDNVQTFYQMKLDGTVLSRVNIENGAYYSSLLSADGTRLSAVADSGNDSEGRARYERIVLLLGDELQAILSQKADGLYDAGQWAGDDTLFCAYGSIGEEKLPVTFYSFDPDQEDSLEQDKKKTGAFNRRLRESLDSYEERFILAGCYDEANDRYYFAVSAKGPSSSYDSCYLEILVTDGEGAFLEDYDLGGTRAPSPLSEYRFYGDIQVSAGGSVLVKTSASSDGLGESIYLLYSADKEREMVLGSYDSARFVGENIACVTSDNKVEIYKKLKDAPYERYTVSTSLYSAMEVVGLNVVGIYPIPESGDLLIHQIVADAEGSNGCGLLLRHRIGTADTELVSLLRYGDRVAGVDAAGVVTISTAAVYEGAKNNAILSMEQEHLDWIWKDKLQYYSEADVKPFSSETGMDAENIIRLIAYFNSNKIYCQGFSIDPSTGDYLIDPEWIFTTINYVTGVYDLEQDRSTLLGNLAAFDVTTGLYKIPLDQYLDSTAAKGEDRELLSLRRKAGENGGYVYEAESRNNSNGMVVRESFEILNDRVYSYSKEEVKSQQVLR